MTGLNHTAEHVPPVELSSMLSRVKKRFAVVSDEESKLQG